MRSFKMFASGLKTVGWYHCGEKNTPSIASSSAIVSMYVLMPTP